VSEATTNGELDGVPILDARSVAEWRGWLEAQGRTSGPVWLVVRHLDSRTPGVHFQEAIEHAVCFGWVDSKAVKRDPESFLLKFSRRTARSSFGAKNQERAARMIAAGLMTPAGQEAIDAAKADGRWAAHAATNLDAIPEDLRAAFDLDPVARQHFEAFPPSSRRLILRWIADAVKPETRARRIATAVNLAARNERANHPKRT
jgi:uncharacterized protein YdeI (YjbR/CyaY-like superfamily)